MKELGTFLIKITVFCFIGAGAGVSSVGIALMNYAKETRTLQYQVEESIGAEPSEETCVSDLARGSLAECKSAPY